RFVASLAQYDVKLFAVRFLRDVREQGLLAATPENELLVGRLAHAAESVPGIGSAQGEALGEWLGPETDPSHRSRWRKRIDSLPRRANPEYLDELSMLLEQIRVAR